MPVTGSFGPRGLKRGVTGTGLTKHGAFSRASPYLFADEKPDTTMEDRLRELAVPEYLESAAEPLEQPTTDLLGQLRESGLLDLADEIGPVLQNARDVLGGARQEYAPTEAEFEAQQQEQLNIIGKAARAQSVVRDPKLTGKQQFDVLEEMGVPVERPESTSTGFGPGSRVSITSIREGTYKGAARDGYLGISDNAEEATRRLSAIRLAKAARDQSWNAYLDPSKADELSLPAVMGGKVQPPWRWAFRLLAARFGQESKQVDEMRKLYTVQERARSGVYDLKDPKVQDTLQLSKQHIAAGIQAALTRSGESDPIVSNAEFNGWVQVLSWFEPIKASLWDGKTWEHPSTGRPYLPLPDEEFDSAVISAWKHGEVAELKQSYARLSPEEQAYQSAKFSTAIAWAIPSTPSLYMARQLEVDIAQTIPEWHAVLSRANLNPKEVVTNPGGFTGLQDVMKIWRLHDPSNIETVSKLVELAEAVRKDASLSDKMVSQLANAGDIIWGIAELAAMASRGYGNAVRLIGPESLGWAEMTDPESPHVKFNEKALRMARKDFEEKLHVLPDMAKIAYEATLNAYDWEYATEAMQWRFAGWFLDAWTPVDILSAGTSLFLKGGAKGAVAFAQHLPLSVGRRRTIMATAKPKVIAFADAADVLSKVTWNPLERGVNHSYDGLKWLAMKGGSVGRLVNFFVQREKLLGEGFRVVVEEQNKRLRGFVVDLWDAYVDAMRAMVNSSTDVDLAKFSRVFADGVVNDTVGPMLRKEAEGVMTIIKKESTEKHDIASVMMGHRALEELTKRARLLAHPTGEFKSATTRNMAEKSLMGIRIGDKIENVPTEALIKGLQSDEVRDRFFEVILANTTNAGFIPIELATLPVMELGGKKVSFADLRAVEVRGDKARLGPMAMKLMKDSLHKGPKEISEILRHEPLPLSRMPAEVTLIGNLIAEHGGPVVAIHNLHWSDGHGIITPRLRGDEYSISPARERVPSAVQTKKVLLEVGIRGGIVLPLSSKLELWVNSVMPVKKGLEAPSWWKKVKFEDHGKPAMIMKDKEGNLLGHQQLRDAYNSRKKSNPDFPEPPGGTKLFESWVTQEIAGYDLTDHSLAKAMYAAGNSEEAHKALSRLSDMGQTALDTAVGEYQKARAGKAARTAANPLNAAAAAITLLSPESAQDWWVYLERAALPARSKRMVEIQKSWQEAGLWNMKSQTPTALGLATALYKFRIDRVYWRTLLLRSVIEESAKFGGGYHKVFNLDDSVPEHLQVAVDAMRPMIGDVQGRLAHSIARHINAGGYKTGHETRSVLTYLHSFWVEQLEEFSARMNVMNPHVDPSVLRRKTTAGIADVEMAEVMARSGTSPMLQDYFQAAMYSLVALEHRLGRSRLFTWLEKNGHISPGLERHGKPMAPGSAHEWVPFSPTKEYGVQPELKTAFEQWQGENLWIRKEAADMLRVDVEIRDHWELLLSTGKDDLMMGSLPTRLGHKLADNLLGIEEAIGRIPGAETGRRAAAFVKFNLLFRAGTGPMARNMYFNGVALSAIRPSHMMNQGFWEHFINYMKNVSYGRLPDKATPEGKVARELIKLKVIQKGPSRVAGVPMTELAYDPIMEAWIRGSFEKTTEFMRKRALQGEEAFGAIIGHVLDAKLHEAVSEMVLKHDDLKEMFVEKAKREWKNPTQRGISTEILEFFFAADVRGVVDKASAGVIGTDRFTQWFASWFNKTDDAWKYAEGMVNGLEKGLTGVKLLDSVMEIWPDYARASAALRTVKVTSDPFAFFTWKMLHILMKSMIKHPLRSRILMETAAYGHVQNMESTETLISNLMMRPEDRGHTVQVGGSNIVMRSWNVVPDVGNAYPGFWITAMSEIMFEPQEAFSNGGTTLWGAALQSVRKVSERLLGGLQINAPETLMNNFWPSPPSVVTEGSPSYSPATLFKEQKEEGPLFGGSGIMRKQAGFRGLPYRGALFPQPVLDAFARTWAGFGLETPVDIRRSIQLEKEQERGKGRARGQALRSSLTEIVQTLGMGKGVSKARKEERKAGGKELGKRRSGEAMARDLGLHKDDAFLRSLIRAVQAPGYEEVDPETGEKTGLGVYDELMRQRGSSVIPYEEDEEILPDLNK